MPVTIRVATPADIPALQALIPQSVRGLSIGYYTPEQMERAITHIFGVDTQLVADGTYYAAMDGDQYAACGGWSKRKTLYGGDQAKLAVDNLLDPATDAARIRAFFVHPNWARQGIGRRLIETCEDAARAAGFRRMEMAATLPGVPLYAAMGYVTIAETIAPMPDGDGLPIVHMGKDI
jgi:GNAT superfamily N-acetyltransferase